MKKQNQTQQKMAFNVLLQSVLELESVGWYDCIFPILFVTIRIINTLTLSHNKKNYQLVNKILKLARKLQSDQSITTHAWSRDIECDLVAMDV